MSEFSEARDEPRDDVWRYDGRRTLVTGASSGIGAATVDELIERGAEVIGVDVAPTSRATRHVVADIGEPDGTDAVLAALDGPVHALFNCAGITGTSGIDRVMDVNFRGLRRLSESVAARMAPGGAIVSVASIAGARWRTNLGAIVDYLAIDDRDEASRWCAAHPELFERGAYSFSKQCIIAWTLATSAALGRSGVRINTISPGNVDTPMLDDAAAIGGRAAVDAVPRPLGRNSHPVEQARAMLFLNSRAASYVTGQDLWTDGGLLGGIALGVHAYPLVASPEPGARIGG
jgi:NAD(P)-dependent dehydrogenase (short-subunit alcohol dehydrogenase family)